MSIRRIPNRVDFQTATTVSDTRKEMGDLFLGYDFNQKVPPEFICISEWNGWYRVSICLAGPDRGTVFWWDGFRSGGPEGAPPSRAQLKTVASDFKEFWEMLEPDDQ
jgi:hypothetical protein